MTLEGFNANCFLVDSFQRNFGLDIFHLDNGIFCVHVRVSYYCFDTSIVFLVLKFLEVLVASLIIFKKSLLASEKG